MSDLQLQKINNITGALHIILVNISLVNIFQSLVVFDLRACPAHSPENTQLFSCPHKTGLYTIDHFCAMDLSPNAITLLLCVMICIYKFTNSCTHTITE